MQERAKAFNTTHILGLSVVFISPDGNSYKNEVTTEM